MGTRNAIRARLRLAVRYQASASAWAQASAEDARVGRYSAAGQAYRYALEDADRRENIIQQALLLADA